ncbi:MAG: histidine kinase N-terminal 7TM domain-containing protein [Patescibacteria group bacterium]
MDIKSIISLVIGILMAIVGLYVFIRNPKARINKAFGFLVLILVLWVAGNIVTSEVNDVKMASIWAKYIFSVALFLPITIIYFSWVFPYESKQVKKRDAFLLLIPVVLVFITLTTNFVVKGLDGIGWHANTIFGSGLYLYILIFLGYWVWAIVNLVNKLNKSDGIHRWQLKNILWGIIPTSVIGIVSSLILPLYGNQNFIWLTLAALFIFIFFTSYIIFKKP